MKTIDEIRRENLLAAIKRAGTASSLADLADVSAAYLSQIKNQSPESKTGKPKNMGDDVARKIERALGEQPGWMDVEHSSSQHDLAISDSNLAVIEQLANAPGANIGVGELTSAQRLKAALKEAGPNAETLAGVAGVGVETALQWLAGNGPEVTLQQAVAIQKTYGVNLVWLTKGKGDPGVAVRFDDEYRPIPITGWKPIPVVGMAQLGDNGHWSDLEYPVGHGDGYVDFPSRDPDAYALRCVGDSMRPRIRDGEFVIIEPNHTVEPGDDVLVKSTDGRVMVKTFLYKRAGRTHLVSINEAHPSMSFANEEIEKMHYVVATTRPSMWRPI